MFKVNLLKSSGSIDAISEMLSKNKSIWKLNLSGIHFYWLNIIIIVNSIVDFKKFGEGIKQNQTLKSLNLSSILFNYIKIQKNLILMTLI